MPDHIKTCSVVGSRYLMQKNVIELRLFGPKVQDSAAYEYSQDASSCFSSLHVGDITTGGDGWIRAPEMAPKKRPNHQPIWEAKRWVHRVCLRGISGASLSI